MSIIKTIDKRNALSAHFTTVSPVFSATIDATHAVALDYCLRAIDNHESLVEACKFLARRLGDLPLHKLFPDDLTGTEISIIKDEVIAAKKFLAEIEDTP